MQLLFDLIPIIIFFLCYKLAGIYAATAAAMVVSVIQLIYFRLKYKRFEMLQVVTLVLILVLGSATLLLHNPLFIKWKPTVIYWIFAIVFLVSGFWGKQPLIQRVLGHKVTLPDHVWRKLNWSWLGYFLVLGGANLYVIYHFSTNAWVDFKLFGTLILTFIFIIGQGLYLQRYLDKTS